MGCRRSLQSGRLWSYSQTSAKLRATNALAYLSIPSVTERKKKLFQHCLPGQFRGRQASPNFSTCGRSIRETDPPPFTSPTRPRNRPICIAAGLEFKKIALFGCVSSFRPFHSTSFCYRSV